MTEDITVKLIPVKFKLNGQEVSAEVPENQMLLRFLRDDLKKTGTKNGCSTGHCGACTVLINGKAQRACLVKMPRVAGTEVETIEHLTANGSLHPLQRAFMYAGAVQCGFCTPGMIMSAKGLLNENPQPHRGRDQNPPHKKQEPLPLHRLCQDHRSHPARCKMDRQPGIDPAGTENAGSDRQIHEEFRCPQPGDRRTSVRG